MPNTAFENRVSLTISAILISFILLCSCSSSSNKSESKSTASSESKSSVGSTEDKAPAAIKEPPSVLKVKGFYLGMSVDEAILRCQEVSRDNLKEYCKYEDDTVGHPWSANIFFDSNKKARKMQLSHNIFNAGDMNVKDYALKFMEAYDIPEMKPSNDGQYLYYISPSGTRIKIDVYKNIHIEYAQAPTFK